MVDATPRFLQHLGELDLACQEETQTIRAPNQECEHCFTHTDRDDAGDECGNDGEMNVGVEDSSAESNGEENDHGVNDHGTNYFAAYNYNASGHDKDSK